MSPAPTRFSRLRWLHTFVCLLAIVGACVLVGMGLVGFESSIRVWLIAAGGFVLFVALVLMTIMPLLIKIESTLARHLGEVRDMREMVSAHANKLSEIAENTRISDAAKSLAHRDQEIDTLRNAIRGELQKQNWEAGFDLIQEVERRFGYKQEAAALREELEETRKQAIQTKLSEAISLINAHFETHDWQRAQSEIDRVLRAVPGEEQVLGLVDRMNLLKERHKTELHKAWDEAVRRHDVDLAIDILKELDQYLAPEEGEALQASARHVFKEKLLQLGVQFRFAVTEKRWQDALTVGLELVRDFPNARMASEVREALDTLRERARLESGSAAART